MMPLYFPNELGPRFEGHLSPQSPIPHPSSSSNSLAAMANSELSPAEYPALHRTVFNLPAIDNHAHPILKEAQRDAFAFEGLVSEAQGTALADSVHTVASMRVTKELAKLYGLDVNTTWEDLKEHRKSIPYSELTKLCFEHAKLQTLLLDDGLTGVEEMAEKYRAHDPLTTSPTKRITRVEVVAEVRIRGPVYTMQISLSGHRLCLRRYSLLTWAQTRSTSHQFCPHSTTRSTTLWKLKPVILLSSRSKASFATERGWTFQRSSPKQA